MRGDLFPLNGRPHLAFTWWCWRGGEVCDGLCRVVPGGGGGSRDCQEVRVLWTGGP